MHATIIGMFDTTHMKMTNWEELAQLLGEEDPDQWSTSRLSSGAADRISWVNRKAFAEAPLIALWNSAARLGNQKASHMCRYEVSYVPLSSLDQMRALENMRGIVAIVKLEDWEDRIKNP